MSWQSLKHVENPRSFFLNIFLSFCFCDETFCFQVFFFETQLISWRNLVFWCSNMKLWPFSFSKNNSFHDSCFRRGRTLNSMCFICGVPVRQWPFWSQENLMCQWSAEVSFAHSHGFHRTIRLFWCSARKGRRGVFALKQTLGFFGSFLVWKVSSFTCHLRSFM